MLQFIQHIIFQLGQAFFAAEATYQGSVIAFGGQEEDGIFMMQILAWQLLNFSFCSCQQL